MIFSEFGAATQLDSMNSAIADLRAKLAAAKSKVGSTWTLWGTESGKTGSEGLLRNSENLINRLDSELRPRVLDGSFAYSTWVEWAQMAYNDIKSAVGLTGEWSMSSILWNTASATAGDVQEIAQEAKKFAFPLLGVAGLVAGAIVLTKADSILKLFKRRAR